MSSDNNIEYYNPDNVETPLKTPEGETLEEQTRGASVEDEQILSELLEKHKSIEEAYQKEIADETAQHVQDADNNYGIFRTWMEQALLDQSLSNQSLYKVFLETFDQEYRTNLFDNICEFFNDSELVSDKFLFHFKMLIISVMKNNKKIKSCLSSLTIDIENQTTNLRLIKAKQTFKIFIEDEFLCYFKENGNDYYVS